MPKIALILLVWVGIAGFDLWYCHQQGISPLELFYRWADWMRVHPAGPLVYAGLFVLRPLLLLPASLLSVSAGFCFGTVWGIFWANLGASVAAMVGWGVGRWLGLRGSDGKLVSNIKRHGEAAVVGMRWCFLPYDLVSYLAGALRLNWFRFLVASTMGNFPGTTSCVLFGSSIQGSLRSGQGVSINWGLQLGSIALMLLMVGLGKWWQRRYRSEDEAT